MKHQRNSEFPIPIVKEEIGNGKKDSKMTTEKQLNANRLNALQSTGPKTEKGKAIISSNAVKHGIFTKDLIVSSHLGKEDEGEYLEMLTNLIGCLSPQNQMESLLVEKIAIDFWRLRRVVRFEAGSIGKFLEEIFNDFYSHPRKTNQEIDAEIEGKKEYLEWLSSYEKCLKRGEVSFDQPTWEGEDIASDILEDFYLILRSIDSIPYAEKDKLLYGPSNFAKLKEVLGQNGYSSKKEISAKLLELYVKQRQQIEDEIVELQRKRLENIEGDRLNSLLGMIPQEDSTDKILKYERSMQKSIFQNLFLLKKLQRVF